MYFRCRGLARGPGFAPIAIAISPNTTTPVLERSIIEHDIRETTRIQIDSWSDSAELDHPMDATRSSGRFGWTEAPRTRGVPLRTGRTLHSDRIDRIVRFTTAPWDTSTSTLLPSAPYSNRGLTSDTFRVTVTCPPLRCPRGLAYLGLRIPHHRGCRGISGSLARSYLSLVHACFWDG